MISISFQQEIVTPPCTGGSTARVFNAMDTVACALTIVPASLDGIEIRI